MNRAALSDKPRPEFLQDRLYRDQDPPEAFHRLAIVRSVSEILIEAYGIRNLHRHRPDLDCDAQTPEGGHELLVEVGHGSRGERNRLAQPSACLEDKVVMQEVKLDFEGAAFVRHG